MPPNAPKPEKLAFNQSLLKAFVAGELSPQVEEKVVAFVQQRPKSLEQAVAHSGGGFLKKLKAVQQRATSADGLVKAPAIAPDSIQPGSASGIAGADVSAVRNESKVSTGVIPSELANYAGYRIVKELGRGGMGVVYLAKNIQMDRLEVLKVLSERLLDHEGAKERFLREIRAVSKLNHVNIVTSYSILPLSSLLVFAMEHVHGMDLHGFIHKHSPLSIGLACAFAMQLAAGLQHAHEKGLVHRDIKPSNVIVYKSDGQLQLKILDFGLAKATSEDNQSGLTQDGMMLGTPAYMSPEQTLNAAKADIRADIYSLGCTLYCMLTGRPPFRGTHGEVLMAHAQRDPQSVNLLRPEVPVELSAIVAKMMAKDVAKRFQTPAEVATALSPFVSQARSGSRSTTDSPAASNTVHDLQASDRDTSVEAPGPSLSLDTSSQVVQPTSQLAEIAQAMGQHRRAATQIARAKRHKRKKSLAPNWMWPAVIAGLMPMFLGGLWMAGVFKLKTPDGTIIVEQLPEDADVLVDGRRLEIMWNAGKDRAEVTIEPGTHQLKVTSKGIEVFGNQVQVRSGQVLAVRCEPLLPETRPLPSPMSTPTQKPDGFAIDTAQTNPTDSELPPQSPPFGGYTTTSSEPQDVNVAAKDQQSLFDGQTLDGWSGRSDLWSIEDGAIVGKTTDNNPIANNTCLIWNGGEVQNFEFELEYRISANGNSGIQFRSKLKDPNEFVMTGFQADIDGSGKFSGILYEEGGRGVLAERGQQVMVDNNAVKSTAAIADTVSLSRVIKPDDWNHYRVLAIGNKVSQFINSQLMCELVDNEADKSAPQGLIGLQLHRGPAMQVRFRNVRLRKFESALPARDEDAFPIDAAMPKSIVAKEAQQSQPQNSIPETRKPIELLQGDLAETWVMSELHAQHWSLKKGILRFDGVGMEALNLTTKRTDFKNFTLNCQWRIGPNGDSGLYLRGKPQVQIWDHVNGKGAGIGSGGLYNNKVFPSRPLTVADNPLGEWNMMSTTIVGDIVTVVLNGRTVTNGVRMEHYPDYQSDLPPAGPLTLQAFGTPLEFRRMTLIELPSQAGTENSDATEASSGAQVFSAGSTWVGINGSTVKISVLECDGTRFSANLQLGGIERIVHGNLSGNGISWLAKDVEVVRGGPGGDNFGVLRSDSTGSVIDFGFRVQSSGISGTFSVRLDEPR